MSNIDIIERLERAIRSNMRIIKYNSYPIEKEDATIRIDILAAKIKSLKEVMFNE